MFADDSGLSGALNVSSRYFLLHGALPDGGLASCHEINAVIYDEDGAAVGLAHLIATNELFANRPSFVGNMSIGAIDVDLTLWRNKSPKAGTFLAGTISLPMIETAA